MKHLNTYITEYIIKKKLDKPIYSGTPILYTPKNNGELVDLIIKLLNDDETNLNCIDVSNVKVIEEKTAEPKKTTKKTTTKKSTKKEVGEK